MPDVKVTMNLKVFEGIGAATVEGVHDAADILRDEVRRLVLDTDKTGRIYDGHQASAPGEPYATWTGDTLSKVRVDKTEDRGKVVLGGINAVRLEYGTERMEPRPVLNPAYRNVQDKMVAAAGGRIRRYLRGTP